MGLAIQNNVTVVDAMETLLAFHQTDRDGNFAGLSYRDNEFNQMSIGVFSYTTGTTISAQYVTKFIADEVCNGTKVILERRHTASTIYAVVGLGALGLCLGIALRLVK